MPLSIYKIAGLFIVITEEKVQHICAFKQMRVLVGVLLLLCHAVAYVTISDKTPVYVSPTYYYNTFGGYTFTAPFTGMMHIKMRGGGGGYQTTVSSYAPTPSYGGAAAYIAIKMLVQANETYYLRVGQGGAFGGQLPGFSRGGGRSVAYEVDGCGGDGRGSNGTYFGSSGGQATSLRLFNGTHWVLQAVAAGGSGSHAENDTSVYSNGPLPGIGGYSGSGAIGVNSNMQLATLNTTLAYGCGADGNYGRGGGYGTVWQDQAGSYFFNDTNRTLQIVNLTNTNGFVWLEPTEAGETDLTGCGRGTGASGCAIIRMYSLCPAVCPELNTRCTNTTNALCSLCLAGMVNTTGKCDCPAGSYGLNCLPCRCGDEFTCSQGYAGTGACTRVRWTSPYDPGMKNISQFNTTGTKQVLFFLAGIGGGIVNFTMPVDGMVEFKLWGGTVVPGGTGGSPAAVRYKRIAKAGHRFHLLVGQWGRVTSASTYYRDTPSGQIRGTQYETVDASWFNGCAGPGAGQWSAVWRYNGTHYFLVAAAAGAMGPPSMVSSDGTVTGTGTVSNAPLAFGNGYGVINPTMSLKQVSTQCGNNWTTTRTAQGGGYGTVGADSLHQWALPGNFMLLDEFSPSSANDISLNAATLTSDKTAFCGGNAGNTGCVWVKVHVECPVCPPNSNCTQSGNSTSCACNQGFFNNTATGQCDCASDKYGAKCTSNCPASCSGGALCDSGIQGSGRCICPPGFKNNTATGQCDDCIDGRWGPACNNTCSVDCRYEDFNSYCDTGVNATGTCLCDFYLPGQRFIHRNETIHNYCDCPYQHTGKNCSFACPVCGPNAHCPDGQNVTLAETYCHCDPWFFREASSQECYCNSTSLYGPGCQYTCPTCGVNEECDWNWRGSGQCKCSGHFVNVTGSGCVQCATGYYGADCNSTCTNPVGSTCNQGTTGDGSYECDAGRYGMYCNVCNNPPNSVCHDRYQGDGMYDCNAGYYGASCVPCNVPANSYCHEGAGGDGLWDCLPGYYGANCDQSCRYIQNAFCSDGVNGQGDVCYSNYNGTDCDQCIPNHFGPSCTACYNPPNSVCSETITGDGTYQCNSGSYGTACYNCDYSACYNGTCNDSYNGDGSCSCHNTRAVYKPQATPPGCYCKTNYFGFDCSIFCNTTSFHQFNATTGGCVCNGTKTERADGFCECPPNTYGKSCQPCDLSLANSHCSQGVYGTGQVSCNTNFTYSYQFEMCICANDIWGPQCQFACPEDCVIRADCDRGALETGFDGTGQCLCRPNTVKKYDGQDQWMGCYPSNCDDNDQCLNGATCVDDLHSESAFSCACAAGYTGQYCDIDIDDCASSPCKNGATCTDDINSFSCTCLPYFYGVNCTNACPCGGHATMCFSGVTGNGTCSCMPGYVNTVTEFYTGEFYPGSDTGFNCRCFGPADDFNDDCDNCDAASGAFPLPDRSACNCTDQYATYDYVVQRMCVCGLGRYMNATGSCVCTDGFAGPTCKININDCVASPCQNGGTCQDKINAYKCVCAAGYNGTDCSINIDECAKLPCKNGGTCVDGINSYVCSCVGGYSGANCTTAYSSSAVPYSSSASYSSSTAPASSSVQYSSSSAVVASSSAVVASSSADVYSSSTPVLSSSVVLLSSSSTTQVLSSSSGLSSSVQLLSSSTGLSSSTATVLSNYTEPCPPFTYGVNCTTCSCALSASCHDGQHGNGTCYCANPLLTYFNDTGSCLCTPPRFGALCEGLCHNCTNPRTSCSAGDGGTGRCECIAPRFVRNDTELVDGFECVCGDGYFGPHCDHCPVCNSQQHCSVNGTCECNEGMVLNLELGTCVCNEFTWGPHCNGTCDAVECGGRNATCSLGSDGTGECVCLYPYVRNATNVCVCDPHTTYGPECTVCECSAGQVCDATGQCLCAGVNQFMYTTAEGEVICACEQGFGGHNCTTTYVDCHDGFMDPIMQVCRCEPGSGWTNVYCNETDDSNEPVSGVDSSSSTGMNVTATPPVDSSSSSDLSTAVIAVISVMSALVLIGLIAAAVLITRQRKQREADTYASLLDDDSIADLQAFDFPSKTEHTENMRTMDKILQVLNKK